MNISVVGLGFMIFTSMIFGTFVQAKSESRIHEFWKVNHAKLADCESNIPRNKFCELQAVPK